MKSLRHVSLMMLLTLSIYGQGTLDSARLLRPSRIRGRCTTAIIPDVASARCRGSLPAT